MLKSIIGTKVGMSQIFAQNGKLIAITAIHVEPNLVVGVKTKAVHGYDAVVVGYGDVREKLVPKPVRGQFAAAQLPLKRKLVQLNGITGLKVGDAIKLTDAFRVGDLVDVQGTSKGHGFTGAIKL